MHLKNTKQKTNLCPARGKPRVASDATHEVQFALTVATQVDGPRGDVDVHEVVDDPALNVVLDPVHQVSAAHVEDFNVRQVPAERRGKETQKCQPSLASCPLLDTTVCLRNKDTDRPVRRRRTNNLSSSDVSM